MSRAFHRRAASVTVAAAIFVFGLCATARADFKTLSQRLPASSNAIIAVNVAKVLDTPYAKNEWTPTAADAWAKQPVMIPPGSTRLLMAADVRSDSLESLWELSLMEMGKMPTIQELAQAEGGNIDRLWDRDAVCSPINAYFVPLDGTILASITPANRAAIAKWVRTPAKPEGNVTSQYLQRVLAGLGDSTDIVMAMDLEGAFGVPRIRKWLDDNDIKEVPDNQMDQVARTLGTMNGIMLQINVDQDVKGRAVVDFDGDAASLQNCAKPIMIAVLNTAGMRVDEIDSWTFKAGGKQVTMEGKLGTPSLRRLLSIVQSPIPAATVAAKPAGGGAQASVPADPAQASQRYYKVICANLDNFRPGGSASETAGWARAVAKRIEQLPILNVDPQLVQWGSMVTLKLKQAGGTMAVAQTQMNARVAGVMDPGYSNYSYDSYGNYTSSASTPDIENAKRQRRQVALEQRAQAQEQAMRVISEIAETRPAIRAAMVEKYKVEF
jgi:hypothetical protein